MIRDKWIERTAMRAYLETQYADTPRPDRLARRCFCTHLFTFSMEELWDDLREAVDAGAPIVEALIGFYFPPEVFGPPE
jgi:hypothetical protein